MAYDAPVSDIEFALNAFARIDRLAGLPAMKHMTPNLCGPCWRKRRSSPAMFSRR